MNRVKKWVGVALVLGIISFFGFSAQSVSAGLASDYGVSDIDDIKPAIQKLEWLDAAHIKMTFKNGKILVFTPGGTENSNSPLQDERLSIEDGYGVRYVAPKADGWTCDVARVEFNINERHDVFTKQSKQLNPGHVDLHFRANADNDCSPGNKFDMAIEHPGLSIAYFKWINPTQIGMVDDDWPGTFTKGDSEATIDGVVYDVFLSDRESGVDTCRNKLILNRVANTVRWYDLGKSGAHDGNPPDDVSTTCGYYDKNDDNPSSFPRNNYDWTLANTSDAVVDVPPSTSGPGGTNTESGDSCESAMDGFTGLWVCPMLTGADRLITATEGIIEKKLQVNTEFTSNEGLHDAWTQLARISSGLLVIVALAMIISTALGFDLVSSYTLKKMLPRIVIGAIGIWLSWALATTYIGFMNDLGRGISGLMFEPFKNLYTDVSSFSDVNLKYIAGHSFSQTDALTDNTAGLVFTGAFVLFIVSHGGLFAILSAGLTIIVAMLIGLFLLALREVLIVFLLIMAPIGVASWMLPNTQKVWKLWSGTFNKLLLLYPLFMGAFTAGKIFALISVHSAKTNNGVIEVLIPMIAYVSPFFFLPVLFKLAGGVFSNITGAVQKGTGFTDKWKSGLQGKKEENKKLRKEASLQDYRMRLAKGDDTRRDKFRNFGQVGFGRKAYKLNRKRNIVQGHKDSLERQMILGGVAEHGARIQATNFSASAAMAKLDEGEAKLREEAATAELRRGLINGAAVGDVTSTDGRGVTTTAPFSFNNAAHLEHVFNTSTDENVKRAAFSQIVASKNDYHTRRIVTASRAATAAAAAGGPAMTEVQKFTEGVIQRASSDGTLGGSFGEKAPDILNPFAFVSIPAPQDTKGWSADTWEIAVSTAVRRGEGSLYSEMLESSPEASSSLNSFKKQAIERGLGLRTTARKADGTYSDQKNDERLRYARPTIRP